MHELRSTWNRLLHFGLNLGTKLRQGQIV
jgi:hypothetical protein